MRIGRIGSLSANSYITSTQRERFLPESEQSAQSKKLPGWQGKDRYTPSGASSADGSVRMTGTFDYLMSAAANAARFDENFDL